MVHLTQIHITSDDSSSSPDVCYLGVSAIFGSDSCI